MRGPIFTPGIKLFLLVMLAALTLLFLIAAGVVWTGAQSPCHVTYVHVWLDDNGHTRLATGAGSNEAVTYFAGNGEVWGVDSTQSSLDTACTQAHQEIATLALATLAGQKMWGAMPNATFEKPDAMVLAYANLLTIKTQAIAGRLPGDEYHLDLYFRELQTGGDYDNDWLTHVKESTQPTARQLAMRFVGANAVYLPIVTGD